MRFISGRRIGVLVIAAASAGLMAAGSASGDVLTSYSPGTHGTFFEVPIPNGGEVDGETFEVPNDSLITAADLYSSVENGTTASATLSLYATTPSINGPQPTGVPLATVSDTPSDFDGGFITYVPFNFTTPIALVGGTEYALVLTSSAADSSYFWYGDQQSYSSGSPYAGGNWIAQAAADQPYAAQPSSALGFEIVGTAVPEPTAAGGLIAVMSAALIQRRRRK